MTAMLRPRRQAEPFDLFVEGRSVAIVGPATPVGDQTAEIDGHDLVARFEWFGECAPGMGTRCDIVYYNRSLGRRMKPGSIPPSVSWVCFRDPGHVRAGNHRAQRIPPKLRKPNLVPISAYDMALAGAAKVTIYGANFYLDRQPYYADSYLPGRLQRLGNMRLISHTVSSHDQIDQRRFMRRLMAEHPQITGDERFLQILGMDDADFHEALGQLWNVYSRQPAPRRSAKGPRLMGKKNTWAHISDGRVRRVRDGSQMDRSFRRHPDWRLWDGPVDIPDEPAPPAEQDDDEAADDEQVVDDGQDGAEGDDEPAYQVVGAGGGWYEITFGGDQVDRVRGREAAEARAAELNLALG